MIKLIQYFFGTIAALIFVLLVACCIIVVTILGVGGVLYPFAPWILDQFNGPVPKWVINVSMGSMLLMFVSMLIAMALSFFDD